MPEDEICDWGQDLLSYAQISQTFTNLVQSIAEAKVISIEAGFGQGKTFLRRRWAQDLRAAGEAVIEIDAQVSDHSGEPVITFLGALIAAAAEQAGDKARFEGLVGQGKALAGLVGRTATRAVLRAGAEEVFDTLGEWVADKAPDQAAFDKAIDAVQGDMSKLAGQMIAAQIAAETARRDELPKQIDKLLDSLTEGRAARRIVVLVDELDRCHPDYAIAFLEAMKLVFNRKGFVFCLMVNADYLESIAHHRFGTRDAGEKYLDKFVDLRLKLAPSNEALVRATKTLAAEMLTPALNIPFGPGPEFTADRAAVLAGEIVGHAPLSFRQIKRVLERVELALRCYRDQPLDAALLVWLALGDVTRGAEGRVPFPKDLLPRAALTPDAPENLLSPSTDHSFEARDQREYEQRTFIANTCPELTALDREQYAIDPPGRDQEYYDYYLVLKGLAPHYIPFHRAVLDAVAQIAR